LGVEVKQLHDGAFLLTHSEYIRDLLKEANIAKAKDLKLLLLMI